MKSATPVSKVNKEAIRLMVADFGYQETANRTGIAYATLRQWAKRGRWNVTHSQAVTSVTKPIAEAHAEALAEMEQETRISLARSARRMAKDCEELPVKHADLAKTVAQTMAIVHRQDENKGQSFTLNVLNMGSLGVSVGNSDSQ